MMNFYFVISFIKLDVWDAITLKYPITLTSDYIKRLFKLQELKVQGQFDTYPNLIESLIRNPALLDRLEELSENTIAVTGLNLASLRSFVIDPQTQQFFDETINTHSSLFEVNVK